MKELVRLPEVLLTDKSINPLAKYLYLVAQAAQPTSISNLASRSGVHPSEASKLCNVLAKAGWIIKVKNGTKITPVPGIPYAVQEQMVRELHAGLSVTPHKIYGAMSRA